MSALDVALLHYREREKLARALMAEGARLWAPIGRDAGLDAWLQTIPRLVLILMAAQAAAAQKADAYVADALAEQGEAVAPDGFVVATALAGIASDGRPLDTLLYSPVVATRSAFAAGATRAAAFAVGQATLRMILHTQVSDAGRAADQIAIATRADTGYVRMLNPPSCSRCAILAGRFYRHSRGFDRHPHCDCIHVPTRNERTAESEGLLSSPREYFRSLPRREQDRIFTKDGAEAIRLGADLSQVVNARRGAAGLSLASRRLTTAEIRALRGGLERGRLQAAKVFGQDIFTTTEGTTARGLAGKRLIAAGAPTIRVAEETVLRRTSTGLVERRVHRRRVQTPRLMPESILRYATGREDAIRLLRRFGYII